MDPFEVLGIPPDASVEDAEAAYAELVAQLDRTRLRAVRSRKRRDATAQQNALDEAIQSIRSAQPPDWSRVTIAASPRAAGTYEAELRSVGRPDLHVRWAGTHAAALHRAVEQQHEPDRGPVRQLEWGAYELLLTGTDARRLVRAVTEAAPVVDELAVVVTAAVDLRVALPEPGAVVALDRVLDVLDDEARYSLLVDVF